MQIIPMRDLKDTVKVEKLCKDNGEVFVTKNGYGRLVVMDIDYWSKQNQELEEAKLRDHRKIGKDLGGLKDIEAGKVMDGPDALNDIRKEYGL